MIITMTARKTRAMRAGLNWKQTQLAYFLGLHPMTISKIERGELKTKLYGRIAHEYKMLCELIEA